MFNTPILDIVLGLVFIFLLYSLLATSVKEAVATALGLRARMLKKGIVEGMLSDTPDHNRITSMLKGIIDYLKEFVYLVLGRFDEKKGLGWMFYKHPLMKNYGSNKIFSHPSYISAGNFSLILVETLKKDLMDKLASDPNFIATSGVSLTADQLVNSSDVIQVCALLDYYRNYYSAIEAAQKAAKAAAPPPNQWQLSAASAGFLGLIAGLVVKIWGSWSVAGPSLGIAFVLGYGVVRNGAGTISWQADRFRGLFPEIGKYLKYICGINPRQGNTQVLEKETMELLSLHMAKSIYNLDAFSKRLGSWFDDTMDRVSGWYKRQAQVILLIIGFVMAFIFNVDVIDIATRLSKDDKLRDKLVQSAVAYSNSHKELPAGGAKDSAAMALAANDDSTYRTEVKDKFRRVDSMVDHDIKDINTLLALGYGDYGRTNDGFKHRLEDKAWLSFPLHHTRMRFDSISAEAGALTGLYDTSAFAWKAALKYSDTALFVILDTRLLFWFGDSILPKGVKVNGKILTEDRNLGKRYKVMGKTAGAVLQEERAFAADQRLFDWELGAYPVQVKTAYMFYILKESKRKWIGFLLLGLAVCLGAPFWFDLLNKIVNLRAAGKKEGATTGDGGSNGKKADGQPVIVQVNNKPGTEEAVG